MTSHSVPWKHTALCKLDDPLQCWQITVHSWTDLQKENHFVFFLMYMGMAFKASFLFPRIQACDEIKALKNDPQELWHLSRFQTGKEMMGFNSSWHTLYLSPWDSVVCTANGCRKDSEGKENILGEETIHSTQSLQVFKKATIFLLCIVCHLNSSEDSICLKVRQPNLAISGLTPCCWSLTKSCNAA